MSTTAYSRSQKTESLPPDGATSGTLYRSNDIPGKKLAYLDHDRIIMRLSEVAIARAAAAKAEETKGAVADMLRHNKANKTRVEHHISFALRMMKKMNFKFGKFIEVEEIFEKEISAQEAAEGSKEGGGGEDKEEGGKAGAQEPALDGGEMLLASADDHGVLLADCESGGKGSSSSSDEEESEFDFDEEQTQPREPVEPPKEGTKKGGTKRKAKLAARKKIKMKAQPLLRDYMETIPEEDSSDDSDHQYVETNKLAREFACEMQAKKAERKREEKSRRDEQRRQEGRQTGMNQGQEGRQARQSREAAAKVVRKHSRRNELFLRKGEAAAKASKKKPALLSCFLSFFFSFFFLFFFLSFFLSFTHHPFLRLPSSLTQFLFAQLPSAFESETGGAGSDAEKNRMRNQSLGFATSDDDAAEGMNVVDFANAVAEADSAHKAGYRAHGESAILRVTGEQGSGKEKAYFVHWEGIDPSTEQPYKASWDLADTKDKKKLYARLLGSHKQEAKKASQVKSNHDHRHFLPVFSPFCSNSHRRFISLDFTLLFPPTIYFLQAPPAPPRADLLTPSTIGADLAAAGASSVAATSIPMGALRQTASGSRMSSASLANAFPAAAAAAAAALDEGRRVSGGGVERKWPEERLLSADAYRTPRVTAMPAVIGTDGAITEHGPPRDCGSEVMDTSGDRISGVATAACILLPGASSTRQAALGASPERRAATQTTSGMDSPPRKKRFFKKKAALGGGGLGVEVPNTALSKVHPKDDVDDNLVDTDED